MARFTLTIDMDNAAFEGRTAYETAAIVRELGHRLVNGNDNFALGESANVRDSNGNTVGRWEVSE